MGGQQPGVPEEPFIARSGILPVNADRPRVLVLNDLANAAQTPETMLNYEIVLVTAQTVRGILWLGICYNCTVRLPQLAYGAPKLGRSCPHIPSSLIQLTHQLVLGERSVAGTYRRQTHVLSI